MASAAPHRRLVKRGREAPRRHRREHPDITGPSNAEKVATGAAHARNLCMPSQTVERPIERANKPWHAVLLAGPRRAAPLIRRVEHPNAGKVQDVRNRRDFGEIRRTRSPQRAMRKPIQGGDQRQRRTWKKPETGVAQRSRLWGPQLRVTQRATLANVNDRNSGQSGCHRKPKIMTRNGIACVWHTAPSRAVGMPATTYRLGFKG